MTVGEFIETLGAFNSERTFQLGLLLAVRPPDQEPTFEVTPFAPIAGVAERGTDVVLIVADEGSLAQIGDVTPIG